MKYAVILFVIVLLLAACSKSKVTCVTPDVFIIISQKDTTQRIVFTGMSFTAYKKNTGFTIVDSTITATGDTTRAIGVTSNNAYMNANFDKYDWEIAFIPSGRKFRFKECTREYRSEKISPDQVQDGVGCSNGITFYVNDTLYVRQGTKAYKSVLDRHYVQLWY